MTSPTCPASFSPLSGSSSSSSSYHCGDIMPTEFLPKPKASEQRQEPLQVGPESLPNSFSLKRKPCVVSWCPHDASEQDGHKSHQCRGEVLSDLTCSIQWVHATSSILIIIQCPPWVEAEPCADDIRAKPLYLGIPLESITGLYLAEAEDSEQQYQAGILDSDQQHKDKLSKVSAILRGPLLDLRFSTSAPPVLIAPTSQIVPANKECVDALRSLQRLSVRTSFHISFLRSSIAKHVQHLLGRLCQAVTDGSLRSSTSLSLNNVIRSLYNGRGGMAVDLTSVWSCLEGRQASTESNSQEAPSRSSNKPDQAPALQHMDCPPPSYSAQNIEKFQTTGSDTVNSVDSDGPSSRPAKRVCVDDTRERWEPLHMTDSINATSSLDVKLRQMQEQLYAQLQEALHKDLMFQLAVVEERLTSRFEASFHSMRDSIRCEMFRRLYEADERLEDALEGHRESLNKDISHKQEEISVSIDEELTSCKVELEGFWNDERRDTEANIEAKLEDVQDKFKAYVEGELQDAVVSLKASFESASIMLSFDN